MKRIVFLFSVAALIAGCQTTPTVKPDPSILRVGVSPRSQPMVFKENGQVMGIEADFARKLGQELNRSVVFVETPWDKLIDHLEQNKIDIVMSNMSITKARGMRINFSTPYLQSGLTALFRRDNLDPMGGLVGNVIRNQTKRIGYVENTTGEFYCLQRFDRAKLKGYGTPQAGIQALVGNKIDMLVHDAPVIWWSAARHERDVVGFPEALNTEPLAWGIARHNPQLLEEVNAVLARWEEDGTTRKVIRNWIPSFDM
jgi:ABC-type amino acid transport substrate-binding protein